MNSSQVQPTVNVGVFQIAILTLSLVVLGALAADTVLVLPPELHTLIQVVDTAVCVVLLADFFVRLYRAES